MERHDFQPIRIFDPQTLEQLGEMYVFKTDVHDVPALVVAGVLPKLTLAHTVSKEHLIDGLVAGLKEIAIENDIVDCYGRPNVYTNSGSELWERRDGRIAQIFELRELIRERVVPEHQSKAISLAPDNEIHFPRVPGHAPIRWIARFA